MKLLDFLTSKRGGINRLNALLISGVAAGGFYFITNTAADQMVKNQPIRSISSVGQGAARPGMRLQNGMLTSINVRDGRNQVATEEERAAMGGNSPLDRYHSNQRALDSLDSSLSMAGTGYSDVGINNDADIELGQTRFSVGNPNIGNSSGNFDPNYGDAGAGHYGAGRAGSAGATGGSSSFAPGSMARASGGAFSGSYGPSGSGASGGGASEGPRRLSGASPTGSNYMAKLSQARAAAGQEASASFGSERNGRGGRGRRTGQGKDEMQDILKKSAAAAANANASANEAGRAFMANAQTSGGMSVDGSQRVGYATSGDLTAKTNAKLKAVGNRLSAEQQRQEELKKDQDNVRHWFWGTLVSSLAAIGAILLLQKSHIPSPGKDIIIWALVAGVAAINATLFIKAAKFVHNWGVSTFISTMSKAIEPVLTGLAVLSAIPGKEGKPSGLKGVWQSIKSRFKYMFSLTGVTDMVTDGVTNAAKGAVAQSMQNKK